MDGAPHSVWSPGSATLDTDRQTRFHNAAQKEIDQYRRSREASRRRARERLENLAVPSLSSRPDFMPAKEVTNIELKTYLSATRAACRQQQNVAIMRNQARLIRSEDMIPEIQRFQSLFRKEGKLNPPCGCGEYGFVAAHCEHIFKILPYSCPYAHATGFFCQQHPHFPKPDKVYELQDVFVVKRFGDDALCDCDVKDEDDFMYLGVDEDAEDVAPGKPDRYGANVFGKYQHTSSTPRQPDIRAAEEVRRWSYPSLQLPHRYQHGRVKSTRPDENMRPQSFLTSSSYLRRQKGVEDKASKRCWGEAGVNFVGQANEAKELFEARANEAEALSSRDPGLQEVMEAVDKLVQLYAVTPKEDDMLRKTPDDS
ncbi:hypothetical protein QBC40DRAFT_297076 [Triangularia verruculosa]|uniref:Uncharacterized protein n=1 Tax=Triangularia verruculosa TaxID=2587418 RepID=A0AAN7AUM9_9PEZI|nr:hypothetical protein QBC40DRAFT_297076 [Triangularia verruculosa]